jgi:sulfide:quinone oxidoreductase
MQTDLDITLMTPERRPLEAFGPTVGAALGALLSERRIEIVTSAYCEVPEAGTVTIHPGGRTVHADRVVALPQLRGPALTGLPQDGGGFIPVDDLCRVDGVDRVWAAGDAADLPVKLGGVAAQMAETAALSIAALAGAAMSPPPLRPVLEGVLMTGGTARHLRYRPAGDGVAEESVFGELAGRIPSGKVAAPRLAAELNRAAQPATA